MYGRVLGSHSCPPMILPSSRGTAAVTHTHRKRLIATERVRSVSLTTTFHYIFKISGIIVHIYSCVCMFKYVCMYILFLCLFLCVYQQLRSSAAEPGVSLCQVNDQKTPGHTLAHIYIVPAQVYSAHSLPPLFSLFCWPHMCPHTLGTTY